MSSVRDLPRPLMIQCTSANRAAIALLLWMARESGYSQARSKLFEGTPLMDEHCVKMCQVMVRLSVMLHLCEIYILVISRNHRDYISRKLAC